jgi:hypothetical protein
MQDVLLIGIGTAIGYTFANRIEKERQTEMKKRIAFCKTLKDNYEFKHFQPQDVFMICLEADSVALEHYKEKK